MAVKTRLNKDNTTAILKKENKATKERLIITGM